MENNRFAFVGKEVTLADFFQGYGVANIFVLLLISVILWLAGGNVSDRMTRRLLPWVIGFLVCFSVVEWIWFFPMPSIMSMVAAILAAVAYGGSRRGLDVAG